jgi:type II secretory pathway pseudopilin PulG
MRVRVRGSRGFKFHPVRVVRSGITLIELMIVMAIVIIMTAAGVMTFGRTDVNTLRASALEVQALFDRARQTALAQRTWTCVSVSPSNGTFAVYLQPSPAITSTDSPILGSPTQTVVLRQGIGLPVRYALSVAGEPLSVYFNQSKSSSPPYVLNNDYVGSTGKSVQMWFDGFGRPNVDPFPPLSAGHWPGVADGVPAERDYGYVTIATSTGAAVVQIVVYASTGSTALRWIKR